MKRIITYLMYFSAIIGVSFSVHGQNPNNLLTYSTSGACGYSTAFCVGTYLGVPVTATKDQYARLMYLPEFNTNNLDSVLIKNVRFSNTIMRNFDAIPRTVKYNVRIYKVSGAGYTLTNRTLLASAVSSTVTIPAGGGVTSLTYSQLTFQQFTATFNKRFSAHDTIALEVESEDHFNQGIYAAMWFGLRSESRQVSYFTATTCGVNVTPTSVYATIGAAYVGYGCPNIGLDIEANAEFFSIPAPPPFVVFKDTICAGAVNIPYAVTPVAHATDYEWDYTGGGVTISGTGPAVNISASMAATSGYLRVKAKNFYGESDWTSRYIQVDSIFRINLNLTNPTICLGDSVALSGPAGFSSYRWEPPTGLTVLDDRATVASPANSHSYTLVVEDQYGCRGIGSTFVSINPGPSIYVAPQSLGICSDSIDVTVTGALAYEWVPTVGLSDPNSGVLKAKPTATTHYTITATDAMGCTTENPVVIKVYPTPNGTITRNGRILTAPTGMNSYLWYKDDVPVVPSAIFHQYNMKTPGNYKVLMVDANGCEFFSNIIIADDITGIAQLAMDQLKLYPNPTKDLITIETDLNVNFRLFTLDGKLIMEGLDTKKVDMSSLATGMYYLEVEDIKSLQKASFKVVKSE